MRTSIRSTLPVAKIDIGTLHKSKITELVNFNKLLKLTSSFSHVGLPDLFLNSEDPKSIEARNLAYWVMHQHWSLSTRDIAFFFNRKNPSYVLKMVNQHYADCSSANKQAYYEKVRLEIVNHLPNAICQN